MIEFFCVRYTVRFRDSHRRERKCFGAGLGLVPEATSRMSSESCPASFHASQALRISCYTATRHAIPGGYFSHPSSDICRTLQCGLSPFLSPPPFDGTSFYM
jgi:hypothetical protein